MLELRLFVALVVAGAALAGTPVSTLVAYLKTFNGHGCNGPLFTVTAYPIGSCIPYSTSTGAGQNGAQTGSFILAVSGTAPNRVISTTTYQDNFCTTTPKTVTGLNGQSTISPDPNQATSATAVVTPNEGECLTSTATTGTHPLPAVVFPYPSSVSTYLSQSVEIETSVPTVNNPNPKDFTSVTMQIQVPSCSTSGSYAPVINYKFQNQCATAYGDESPYGTKSIGFQCYGNNGGTFTFYNNPNCANPYNTGILEINYGVPSSTCLTSAAQSDGQSYLPYGQFMYVSCNGGAPATYPSPPAGGAGAQGWVYLNVYSGPKCSGTVSGLVNGYPLNQCIPEYSAVAGYGVIITGSIMYVSSSTSGQCTVTITNYLDANCASVSGTPQANPSSCEELSVAYPTGYIEIAWHAQSIRQVCYPGKALPPGLGLTTTTNQLSDCSGLTVGFNSQALGNFNYSNAELLNPPNGPMHVPMQFSASCNTKQIIQTLTPYGFDAISETHSSTVSFLPMGCLSVSTSDGVSGLMSVCDGANPVPDSDNMYSISPGGIAGLILGYLTCIVLFAGLGYFVGAHMNIFGHKSDTTGAAPAAPSAPMVTNSSGMKTFGMAAQSASDSSA